jgi:hypothetical protein
VKMFKVVTLAAAMLCTPAAFAGSVPGEKLDSGLGYLPAHYTGAEYMTELQLVGESLDNGLGQLSSKYRGTEYMNALVFVGESLDSGLGELSPTYTAAEYTTPELYIVGDSFDNGLGELTQADVTIIMIMASNTL